MENSKTSNGPAALAVFLAIASALFTTHSNRVVFTNDEGLILESARRMLTGARLYVDFYGHMSPGSFWLQEAVFRLFGTSLWAGRVIVILDFSAQCALVFWLVARMASRPAAIVTAITFAGFQIADPSLLTAQHRWDSATFALAGLCVLVYAKGRPGACPTGWVASGALMAAAAWCTPALALPGGLVAGWLGIDRARRRHLVAWISGVAAISVSAVAALMFSGNFGAFLDQMAWLRRNYSGVNVMPYGAIIGGYRALLSDAHGAAEFAVRCGLVICLALPAILPIAAVAFTGLGLWRKRISPAERPLIALLAVCVIALAATVFPRADIAHLAFVAALPYALTAIMLARLFPARAGAAAAGVMLPLAIAFGGNFFSSLRDTERVPSPAGLVRVSAPQATELRTLLAQVHPGDSLFVYPYMPIQYFLTQANNPTRFSYLGPGMMTGEEESAALAELQANPPEWVTFLRLSRDEFLRVFPHASNLDWHFPRLEAWLEENYQAVDNPAVNISGYQLWRRAPGGHNISAVATQDQK
jgi:hypothetical protein